MINWLILVTSSEKISQNFFSFKGDSVWSLKLVDDNKSITVWGTCAVLKIYGGPILTEDLLRPKTMGNLKLHLHSMGRCWNNSVWWNCFLCRLFGYQSHHAFIFCQFVGLVFQKLHMRRRGVVNIWLSYQFSRKKCSYVNNNFVIV